MIYINKQIHDVTESKRGHIKSSPLLSGVSIVTRLLSFVLRHRLPISCKTLRNNVGEILILFSVYKMEVSSDYKIDLLSALLLICQNCQFWNKYLFVFYFPRVYF